MRPLLRSLLPSLALLLCGCGNGTLSDVWHAFPTGVFNPPTDGGGGGGGGTGGIPLYRNPGGGRDDPEGTLLGRPIVTIEQASALGTQGDIALVDWDQYLQIAKGGVSEASSIHVEFLTAQQVFRWIVRNNGQPIPRSPLTPAYGTITTSPFVVLDTRA